MSRTPSAESSDPRKAARELVERASAEGRSVLLEHELLDLFEAFGLDVPARVLVPAGELDRAAPLLGPLEGRAVVVKVVSPRILHKTEVGGGAFLDRATPAEVARAGREMLARLEPELRASVIGFLLEEKVPLSAGLGGELLLGLRESEEFGPVFTFGFGGTSVEALAAAMRPGQSTVLFHRDLTTDAMLRRKLEASYFFRHLTGGVRGVRGRADAAALLGALTRIAEGMDRIRLAANEAGHRLLELECNPLALSEAGRLVPLDALARLGGPPAAASPFPLENLAAALRPKRVALVGVSTKMNMGRIILRCILEAGFPVEDLRVIREGSSEIDGARCVPSISALDGEVDLLVLSVPADGVPAVLAEALASKKVRSVLLIPGGMGETEGGKKIEEEVLRLLRAAEGPSRPVLIGNNSLGLVSREARFDSLFIPHAKLPRSDRGLRNVALLSQSGAFMITQVSKLHSLSPSYQISVGNQIDARLSYFLEAVAADEKVRTFGLYIEGLKDGDGERLGRLVTECAHADRDVILYKAGRSGLGQAAARGHTASVSGDYRIFEDLLRDAGGMVAATFTEFLDLLYLSSLLHGKRFAGRRAAFVSNAGYEVVGMADNHRGPDHALEAAVLGGGTARRIGEALAEARIAALVNVTNPLDVTPMAPDAVHEACARALLDDPGVDLAVFANVPLSPNVKTLPRGLLEGDAFDDDASYAPRMIRVFRSTDKPFVVVVDSGRLYDPMCHFLEDAGLPVFRCADRATVALGRYVESRLSRTKG
jgi:acyl-CoA synthetase (NDP forming)